MIPSMLRSVPATRSMSISTAQGLSRYSQTTRTASPLRRFQLSQITSSHSSSQQAVLSAFSPIYRRALSTEHNTSSTAGNNSFPPPGFNAEQAKKPLPSSQSQRNSTINQQIQVQAAQEKAKTEASKSESSGSGNGNAAAPNKDNSASAKEQKSSSSNAVSKKPEEGEKKKLTMGQKIKKEVQHYWDGTKLLATEVRISTKLVVKMLLGYELSRRENRQVCCNT